MIFPPQKQSKTFDEQAARLRSAAFEAFMQATHQIQTHSPPPIHFTLNPQQHQTVTGRTFTTPINVPDEITSQASQSNTVIVSPPTALAQTFPIQTAQPIELLKIDQPMMQKRKELA